MKIRKDGEITRESILIAATRIFGEKGYHKATHAEIGQAAGVNAALINFHFGSKDDLYRSVWERIDQEIEQLYPIDGGIPAEAPAQERLRGIIRCLLNEALDPRLEGFHRIMTIEMINPTGLLDQLIAQRRKEHHSRLLAVIGEILGPDADEKTIGLCEMSVISQCRIILPKPSPKLRKRYKHSDVELLTEHITSFSLAGIDAVRSHIKGRVK